MNLALREYAERHRRVEALERHAAAAGAWNYPGWQEQRHPDKDPAA